MKKSARIAGLYAVFSAIAILVNLLAQVCSMHIYAGMLAIDLSILVGTMAGLIVKYILDKKYIFQYKSDDLSHDGRLFFFYTLAGGVTTVIFWGCEYMFHLMFAQTYMRYIGGGIGLVIGYAIKYHLDKRFVFVAKGDKEEEACLSS